MTGRADLCAALRRWADARDRRYEQNHPHGAHGRTGTALLRESAGEIDRLRDALAESERHRRALAHLTNDLGDELDAAAVKLEMTDV